MSTHVLNLNFKLLLSPFLSSLESHVFEEMSSSIVGSCFITGSSIDPNTHSSRFTSHDGFGCHTQTRVQGSNVGGGCTKDIGGEISGGSGGEASCPRLLKVLPANLYCVLSSLQSVFKGLFAHQHCQ